MTNNNQPLKGLQGETAEQAAYKDSNAQWVKDLGYSDTVIYDTFKRGAKWQIEKSIKSVGNIDAELIATEYANQYPDRNYHDLQHAVIYGIMAHANHQSHHPTEKESATVDEMAEMYYGNDPNLYAAQRDGFKAGYNRRDKEQAWAVDLIKDRIAELELEKSKAVYDSDHEIVLTIRIQDFKNILAQLTK